MGIWNSIFSRKKPSRNTAIDDNNTSNSNGFSSDAGHFSESSSLDFSSAVLDAEYIIEENIPDLSPIEKIKRELECPVCNEIPTKLPVPCCPEGHLLCQKCKENLLPDEFQEVRCPVCRTYFEEDISILASSLVSFLLDIPCSAMTLGCSFNGTLDQLEAHLCPYQNIFCFVCRDQMRRMEFFNHNSSCFIFDANNSFAFPADTSYLIIKNQKLEVFVCLNKVEDIAKEVGTVYRFRFKSVPENFVVLQDSSLSSLVVTVEHLKDTSDKKSFRFNIQKIPAWTDCSYQEMFLVDGKYDDDRESFIIKFSFENWNVFSTWHCGVW